MMRKKFPSFPPVFFCFLFLMVMCKAPAQGETPRASAPGKGRLQAVIESLEESPNPEANRLAKKVRFVAKEIKSDGKDTGALRPYVDRLEQSAQAGNFEAADRALMDIIGEAYNAEFWKEVSFKSVDGFKVYGYLSEPKGRGKSPVVVLVHGGEHGSATSYQRHAFRFLKAGFGTLAVDYRGSSGHSENYRAAADPAGKEIDDVVKAVEYAHGLPSTTKVGLMGSSHGAFIGANVLTRSSMVSAANLNFGGYNFRTLLEEWKKSDDSIARKKIETWSPVIGDPDNPDFSKARALSPIDNVDKINTPLLLVHGKSDKVVPYSESVSLYEALKKKKKKVSLRAFTDGPHGFIFQSTEEGESAFQTTESFFRRYLK
jgi:dienelactone hydrolase